MIHLTASDLKRFESKVLAGDEDACWRWAGSHFTTGYPAFWLNGNNVGAHRLALALSVGGWPEVARHTCDTPWCVNAAHLVDGTFADNSDDMVERERSLRGSDHPNSKLTEDDVLAILARRELGEGVTSISRDYPDVSMQAVWLVCHRKNWSHV